MSYDLMVFDPSAAPRERDAFLSWFDMQAKWDEEHSYEDPEAAAPCLRDWFHEFKETFPAMNGPYAAPEEMIDDPHLTDYSIGKNVIYCCFAWSLASEAYTAMKESAARHRIGFFNVSDENGEIDFPPSEGGTSAPSQKSSWRQKFFGQK